MCNIITFPLQQWLHEGASMFRYTYIACLVYAKLLRKTKLWKLFPRHTAWPVFNENSVAIAGLIPADTVSYVLGASAKHMQKATNCYILSVHPAVGIESRVSRTMFLISCLGLALKFVDGYRFWLKSVKNDKHFTIKLCPFTSSVFMIYTVHILCEVSSWCRRNSWRSRNNWDRVLCKVSAND